MARFRRDLSPHVILHSALPLKRPQVPGNYFSEKVRGIEVSYSTNISKYFIIDIEHRTRQFSEKVRGMEVLYTVVLTFVYSV